MNLEDIFYVLNDRLRKAVQCLEVRSWFKTSLCHFLLEGKKGALAPFAYRTTSSDSICWDWDCERRVYQERLGALSLERAFGSGSDGT